MYSLACVSGSDVFMFIFGLPIVAAVVLICLSVVVAIEIFKSQWALAKEKKVKQ